VTDKKADTPKPKLQEPTEQPKQPTESEAAPSKPASRLRRRPTRNV